MGKYDMSGFKNKIAPRDKAEIEEKASDRFNMADQTLGVVAKQTEAVVQSVSEATQISFARVIRKTFSMPESELSLIEQVKNKALNRRVVLGEGEVLRIGLMMVSELSDDELEKVSGRLEKMPLGRPPKIRLS
ncbi:MAG: hypothetical protein A3F11_06935 [Gammaproteobacteria bacterium RIFCSPHIGHO2_12_FULL_37_14]|nr:MAG: hypothetical protein A3F11_06935 [Gammaproteobacteria bacterium RIFCSPHIGHO2_12_FULL_37_14]